MVLSVRHTFTRWVKSVTNFSNLKSDNFLSKLFFNYKKVLKSSVEDDLLFLQ